MILTFRIYATIELEVPSSSVAGISEMKNWVKDNVSLSQSHESATPSPLDVKRITVKTSAIQMVIDKKA